MVMQGQPHAQRLRAACQRTDFRALASLVAIAAALIASSAPYASYLQIVQQTQALHRRYVRALALLARRGLAAPA